jgi:hypothetical protein
VKWIRLDQVDLYSFYLLTLFSDIHQKPCKEDSSFTVAAIFIKAKRDCYLEAIVYNLIAIIEASLSIIASLRVNFEAVQGLSEQVDDSFARVAISRGLLTVDYCS